MRLLPLTALLLLGCASWTDTRAPWETARTQDVGRPVLSFRWKKVIADHATTHHPQEMAQPAVSSDDPDSGIVFIGSHAGRFHALSAVDGHELWRRDLGSVSGAPVVLGDQIYLGNDEGVMMALSASTGATRWSYRQNGAILRPPVASGDLLLFTSDGDRVVALDRDTGKWRWQYEREPPEEFTVRGHAGVVVDGEQVITGFSDGHLVALARATGEVLWVRSLAGEVAQFVDVDATPVVEDGVVYAASVQGGLYGLSAADGTESWRTRITGASELVLDDGHLYVAAAESGLHALDRDGNLLWRQGFARAGDPAAPVIDGHLLYLDVSETGLYIIDKRDGSLLQSFLPGTGITSSPAIAGDRMYVMSNGGILYAFGLRRY
jgi:outer membrane protein assembly factor BamB